MKHILKLYKIMLRYWGYLISGLFFMFGFAFLSGLSLTIAIPLFDYVFTPRTSESVYTESPEFFQAIGDTINFYSEKAGGLFGLKNETIRTPFIEALKDVMSKTDPWLLLMVICVTFLSLVFLKNIFFFANKILFANLRGRTIYEIRNVIFRKYLQQSFKFFNINQVGDSIVRMVNDVNIVSNMFIDQVFNLLRDLILLSVYAGVAIYLNARIFFLSLVVLPIFSLLVGLLGKKIKKYAKRIQEKFSEMFSNIEEVLNNMKIVKAFARENYEQDRFKKINWQHFRFWRKSIIYASVNTPLGEIHGTLTAIVVLLIGGTMVLNPEQGFSYGAFMTFLFAIFSMLHPIKTLTKAYGDIKKAQVSLDRIFFILNHKSEIENAENPIHKNSFDKNIIFKNVNFAYNEKSKVLNNIDLEINKGEKVAFVGGSGAGKTTLINLLPRMYDVSSGEILIDQINVNQIELKDLRRLFGTVTQESILFSDTIANNIRYGTLEDVSDEVVEKAAKIAYADEFIEKLPNKYEEMLHSKGANFSGGQKQRLCIARAIVNNPPILMFDEATSALDTEAEKNVQLAIDQATKNRTVLVIAHRLSTVLSADKIVVLDKGEIVGIGKHKELLKTCERYKTLYQLQFEDK
ncbi:ABC transporter ATP-binding protein [candidate division KSB1 bacterium]|nr:ABC transporter ATP-binding protein [candidate division KSB1 bacterium]MBL7093485.1 ABC transporter ATP-binding protein [candidate division KSB1 bacterium]